MRLGRINMIAPKARKRRVKMTHLAPFSIQDEKFGAL
jgi:hypothetical protein